MIRNALRRTPSLILLALLTASPVLAAKGAIRPHGARPVTPSVWSVLLTKVAEALAQPQSDAGPTMDPIGH